MIPFQVEVQVELEDLEDEDNEQDQELFEIDPFDTVVGQEEPDSDSDEEVDEEKSLSDLSSDGEDMDDEAQPFEIPTNLKHIQNMVKKLDAVLILIFEHFHRAHTSITTSGMLPSISSPYLPPLPPMGSPSLSGTPSSSTVALLGTEDATPTPSSPSPPLSQPQNFQNSKTFLRTQFHSLLAIFDRTILRTFKSRYTQFLIFWYTSLDPEFSDIFQGMLVDRALFENSADSTTQNNTPAVTRAAAASYIGSFVSRATFIDREGTRRVVAVLCEYLKAHLDAVEEMLREDALGSGSVRPHTVFYAVTQAVFLIFCFRWRDLLEDEEGEEELLLEGPSKTGRKWISQLNIMQRVVSSILNPLQVSRFFHGPSSYTSHRYFLKRSAHLMS